jgi:hypothetical protein
VNFSIDLAPGSLRGTLEVSLQAFSRVPGTLPEPPTAGCALGQIGLLQRVHVDGKGGYLPIRAEARGPAQGLWTLELPSDIVDDFWFTRIDSDDFALVLNSDHPDFAALWSDDGSFSALYWEIFAAWLSAMVYQVSQRKETGGSTMQQALGEASRPDSYPNLAMLYHSVCARIPGTDPAELNPAQIGEFVRACIAREILPKLTSRPTSGAVR